jgi:predicted dehydrogenase
MAAKKVINWGILSTAEINRAVIPPIKSLSQAELYGIASRDHQKARNYARKNGFIKSYGSYQDLLDDPDIDAVYISLPNGLHHEWIMKSLAAGKHVLCEKSLVTSYVDMKEVMREAEERKLLVMEAFMFRYHAFFRKIEEYAKSDLVGRIHNIQTSFAYILDKKDDIRLNPDLGPGVMGDLGCYCLNFCRTLMGAEPFSWTSHVHYNDQGIDMEARVELLFSEERTAQIFSSFTTNGSFANIIGEKGRLNIIDPFRADTGKGEFLYFSADGKKREKVKVTAEKSGYFLEVEDFTNAILEHRKPGLSIEDSLNNILIMEDVVENGRLV